jgi:pimeloyl-ACP methyl ester carboxylesterase
MRRWVLRILLVLLIVVFVVPLLIPLPEVGADPRTLADANGAFIEVDGIDAYYIAMGPETGPAVMLLHGLGGSTFSWRENMQPLAEAGYRVVAYDRPPFGLTEKAEGFDYGAPNQARFAARLMDALAINRAVMVGHSAGGGVIAQFALQYPDRVDGLVFVAGAVGVGGGAPPLVGSILGFPPITRWGRLAARLIVSPEWYGSTLASAYGASFEVTDAIKAGYTRVLQVRNWDAGLMALLRDSSQNAVPLDRLTALDMPALLIWGRDDTWVPLAVGERLAEILPDERLVIYDGVGHLPMEETPESFNVDVLEWLAAASEPLPSS